MKLIIDIPDIEYKYTCEMRLHNRTYYDDAIRKGTPFDSVIEDIKAEIKNLKGTFSNEYYLKIIDKHISGKEK